MCAVGKKLRDEYPDAFSRVRGVTVTVFRDTTVCLDADGKPLRDCILWMDQRRAEHPKQLSAARRALFALVGMGETIRMLQRTAACNWIAENEPELWAKTDKYVCLSTYLNYRLTGRLADSQASLLAKFPYDYKNRRWDEHGLTRDAYDIPQRMLCEAVPSGTVLGGVTEEAASLTGLYAGLPVYASGSDKGCETVGLSVIREDRAALSFGTSCTVQFATRRYFEPTPFMPAYPAVPNDMYNPEIQLWRGYWMLTWFKQNFAQPEVDEAKRLGCSAKELLNRHLKEIPPGSDGLLVLPHWTPGLATPNTRGAMIGFSDVHTRYHVYRAIIEGINYGLMEGLRGMEKRSGQKIRHLYLGGGGSRSDAICQITADMFGLPVSRVQTNETSALGAAVSVYVALGEYASYEDAIAGMVRLRDTFEPDPAVHELYERIYREVYTKYYKTVAPLHKALRAITAGKQ
jgi:sugar (pentulose or hexulose) kinase